MGGAGFIVIFLSLAYLTGYYSAYRPHTPQTELGWNVHLTWTHPASYGNAQEESLLISLHKSLFPFFLLIALGEIIRIYIIERDS